LNSQHAATAAQLEVMVMPVSETTDLLDMAKINSLPHPLTAVFSGGDRWEIHDIDVETGLLRILAGGLLQIKQFGELCEIVDGDFEEHDSDEFYIEA